MTVSDSRDEAILAAIESGRLEKAMADDAAAVELFAAHQKLEVLFALLRQAAGLVPETGLTQELSPRRAKSEA